MDYEDSPDAALTQPFQPIPQDVYAEFFKTRLPPKGTVIYIARRQMRQHPSGGHALSTDLNLPGPDADHPEKIGSIHAVTFFIQNIVFQGRGLLDERTFSAECRIPAGVPAVCAAGLAPGNARTMASRESNIEREADYAIRICVEPNQSRLDSMKSTLHSRVKSDPNQLIWRNL